MLRKATLAGVLSATLTTTTIAQSGQMTAAEYDRAVNLLGPNLTGLVVGGTVGANWLPDGRFWYRAESATGSEFRLVAPATRHAVSGERFLTQPGRGIIRAECQAVLGAGRHHPIWLADALKG